MDQEKIGKFIAICRKEEGLTQAQLAEKLNITDRAVSKWETGKSMPDSSIMLELCGLLNISVNELLTGGRIDMSDMDKYKENAENNLISLLHNKKKLFMWHYNVPYFPCYSSSKYHAGNYYASDGYSDFVLWKYCNLLLWEISESKLTIRCLTNRPTQIKKPLLWQQYSHALK